jgi:RHS repeat-associated protein
MYLHHDGVNTSTSTHLAFSVRVPDGGASLVIEAYGPTDNILGQVPLNNYITGGSMAADTWYDVNIPLADLSATSTTLRGIVGMRSTAGTVYWDDIKLIAAGSGGGGTTVRYVHTDHLTGSNVVTDASGVLAETMDYYPYGALRIDEKVGGYGGERRKFIGQEYDTSTALSYLQARYYSGNRGQFLSEDPVHLALGNPAQVQGYTGLPEQAYLADPQLLNSYSYARDNPITKSDPKGLSAAGAPIGPWGLLLSLFIPNETSYDPVYEPEQYAAQHSATNRIMGMTMGMQGGGKGGRALNAEGKLINSVEGARREAWAKQEQAILNPGADILTQRTLLNADGSKAIDPITGIGRRIDIAVVNNGKVTSRLEVTSLTADKRAQFAREERIINNGGTYVRGSDGKLINFANTGGVTIPATITRKPRRRRREKMNRKKLLPLDPQYVITNWKNTLNFYRHNVQPGLSEWEIERMKYSWFLFYKFFQDNGLTTRKLVDTTDDMDSLIVRVGDFTPDGEEIYRFAAAEERYSNALDRGTQPEKAVKTILERDFKKLREGKLWNKQRLSNMDSKT